MQHLQCNQMLIAQDVYGACSTKDMQYHERRAGSCQRPHHMKDKTSLSLDQFQ